MESQRVGQTQSNGASTLRKFGRLPLYFTLFFAMGACILIFSIPAMAQSGLEGRITQTINSLVRIVNILIVGFIVWSGFLIAKGEGSGFQRLIYGIVGLIVANAAYVIINYFNY